MSTRRLIPLSPRAHVLPALALAALFALFFGSPARGAEDTVAFGPHDVHSVFYVAKSENQNQIHYALRLDAACRPIGKRPVFAYWRRLDEESASIVDAPLTGLGRNYYGASDDQVVELGPSGGRVQMYVKAIKKVRIEIGIEKPDTDCQTTTVTTLRGVRARLSHAFVQLGGFGVRVRWVELVGYDANGKRITERIKR